jgi:hypothetical protein
VINASPMREKPMMARTWRSQLQAPSGTRKAHRQQKEATYPIKTKRLETAVQIGRRRRRKKPITHRDAVHDCSFIPCVPTSPFGGWQIFNHPPLNEGTHERSSVSLWFVSFLAETRGWRVSKVRLDATPDDWCPFGNAIFGSGMIGTILVTPTKRTKWHPLEAELCIFATIRQYLADKRSVLIDRLIPPRQIAARCAKTKT